MDLPLLYIDLGSPYAYLAVERAPRVLGLEPLLRPVLLGAIFGLRGYGSWAHTAGRARRVAEIEARAESGGLPPLMWPDGWPADGLLAMRCAVWADRRGALAPFARAVLRAEFASGADISDPDVLAGGAGAAGLDPEAMLEGAGEPEVKSELRRQTEDAWAAGVRGVPSVRIGRTVLFGDDQLELAAGLLATAGA